MRRQIPFRKEAFLPLPAGQLLGSHGEEFKEQRIEERERIERVVSEEEKEKAGEDDEDEKFAGKAVDTSISLPFIRFLCRNIRRIHISKSSIA